MKNIKIENASLGDLNILAAIDTQHKNAGGWKYESFVSQLKQNNSLLLKAEISNEIIGFIAAKIIAPEVQIINIAIDEKFLRRGIGEKLIFTLKKTAQKNNFAKITLEVNEKNTAAINLYKKNGFEIVGRRAKFYNGADDALLMDMEIK